jgi:hypothetical protein
MRSTRAGASGRPAEALSLAPGPLEPGANPFLDHGSLELGEHTHHLIQRLARWGRRVETLLVEEQIDSQRVQLGEEADQILQATAEPINRPRHDDVELPLGSVPAHPLKLRALLPARGTAYAVIPVDVDDLAAHAASDLAQFAFLVGGGLLCGRDPEVENSAFHRRDFPSFTTKSMTAFCPPIWWHSFVRPLAEPYGAAVARSGGQGRLHLGAARRARP